MTRRERGKVGRERVPEPQQGRGAGDCPLLCTRESEELRGGPVHVPGAGCTGSAAPVLFMTANGMEEGSWASPQPAGALKAKC